MLKSLILLSDFMMQGRCKILLNTMAKEYAPALFNVMSIVLASWLCLANYILLGMSEIPLLMVIRASK